jgi:hypothetical protein
LTTLTSKYFVVGAFVPILVFGFINGAILYKEFNWFRRWAEPQLTGTARAFDAATVLVGLAVVAYVLWSLTAFLRLTLEGAFLGKDSALGHYLRSRQLRLRTGLRTQYYQARDQTAEIVATMPQWKKKLSAAAGDGKKETTNTYDPRNGPAANALEHLRKCRVETFPPAFDKLDDAVRAFENELRTNNFSIPADSVLFRHWRELLTLFDYAREEWEAREVALANQLQARYGTGAIAPTSLGNIAESMQSYTLTRYRMNFVTFWARLQPVLQKKTELYSALQDVKLQLDFLVACVWLASVTTLLWVIALPLSSHVGWLLLTVVIAGPLTVWLFYRAAVENYLGFGETVRTSVDLHRLELLDALHVHKPNGLREEREMWEALQRVVSYGQQGIEISYAHQEEAKK